MSICLGGVGSSRNSLKPENQNMQRKRHNLRIRSIILRASTKNPVKSTKQVFLNSKLPKEKAQRRQISQVKPKSLSLGSL